MCIYLLSQARVRNETTGRHAGPNRTACAHPTVVDGKYLHRYRQAEGPLRIRNVNPAGAIGYPSLKFQTGVRQVRSRMVVTSSGFTHYHVPDQSPPMSEDPCKYNNPPQYTGDVVWVYTFDRVYHALTSKQQRGWLRSEI